ncbi:WxL domain-containing protein, partial [Enterococcus faecium]|nr:WxL domain-containing protein [Enterococcus faecium]
VSIGVFADTPGTSQSTIPNPSSESTPVTTILTVPHTDTPKAPTASNNNNPTNKQVVVEGENGNLGIAYYPESFKFSGQLGNSSLQLSDSEDNNSLNSTYNIGITDNTHTHNSWTLTAKLTWTKGQLPGSTIKLSNSNGVVKQNKNNGTNNFQGSDLVDQDPKVVTGNSDVSIGESAQTIMSKPNSTIGIGTYDYQLAELGHLQLNIPNATSLQAGTYTGQVTWDLAIVPGTDANGD